MPRPVLPPTPASSTDLKAQDGSRQMAALQMAFELPPPAITSSEPPKLPPAESKFSPVNEPVQQTPPGTPYPMQASEAVKSRRRSSANPPTRKNQFSLPPPPTRSRKIIQVKPRPQDECDHPAAGPPSTAKGAGNTKPAAAAAAAGGTSQAAGSKKKQPPAASAAGRKMARKTAHSLIERRRRSKMNEEFNVLKDMIPACTGEMHKLAILQASIEYLRYLEDCVATLKARQGIDADSQPPGLSLPPLPGCEQFHAEPHSQPLTGGNSPDVDMAGSEARSPKWAESHPRSQRPSISPALLAQDPGLHRDSLSSATTDQRHFSFSASENTFPGFGPQAYHGYAHSTHSASESTLTSPALVPQSDIDQEATAALMMLNQGDRRGASRTPATRGMSVRDLLTT